MKNAKFWIIILVLVILLVTFSWLKQKPNIQPESEAPQNPNPQQSQSVNIASTNPDPLDNTIISADQIIEINFDKPLENIPEFRIRLDPEIEFEVELSSDRKRAKIIPSEEYELGVTYTLFISQDSKFDNGARLDGEKIFHFRTIRYRGT